MEGKVRQAGQGKAGKVRQVRQAGQGSAGFKTEEEAARAYNKEAERLLGESARLNPLPARD